MDGDHLIPQQIRLTHGAVHEVNELTSPKARQDYPLELRRISYHDDETNRDYVFMTNALSLTAQEIADIYKARWQVELFFKWIKQNLKIKTFWGTSRNAVFTQILGAMIVYMLLWIAKFTDAIGSSCQRILQLMKTTLFDNRSIANLFESPAPPGQNLTGQLYFGGLKN